MPSPSDDPDELALAHRKLGYRAAYCPPVELNDKDLTWDVEMNVHFREVTVGAGAIDYRTYLKRLAGLGGDVPLMLEHCPNAAEYDRGRRHLFELGPKIGVRFG